MTPSSTRFTWRNLFPDPGLPYELFNSAVLLLGLAYLWYVGSPPSAVTVSTVGDVYAVVLSPTGWGQGMILAALAGIACSYLARAWWTALRVGYLLLITTTGGWSVALLVGVVFAEPGRDLAFKALGSSLLFASICRGLIADVMKADDMRDHA